MSETLSVARTIPASAERIFKAWLDPDEHSKMTGAGATGGEGGVFTAWDGYISGATVVTTPYTRIEQTWRTTEFPAEAPDSNLVITLEEVDGGTSVTINQANLPDGQAARYAKGWEEFYFTPMTRYFGSAGSRLKDVSEAIGEAIDDAGKQVEAAVKKTRKRATREAEKAVAAVKKVQKKAVAKAKAVGKKVKSLLTRKPAKKADAGKAKSVKSKRAAPVKAKKAAAKAKKKPKR